MDEMKHMTLKQLNAEIKRAAKALKDAKENDREMTELRGFSAYGNEIAYYTKRVTELKEKQPAVEQEEEAKALKRIAAKQIKDKTSTIEYIQKGNDLYGITPGGLRWVADHNWNGMTERTLHCYALRVNFELIFTSGTIDTVLEEVAKR